MVKEYRKLIIMIIIGGLSVMSILGCEKQEEKNNLNNENCRILFLEVHARHVL